MYVHTYVSIYVSLYVCVCVYVFIYVSIYVCMYVVLKNSLTMTDICQKGMSLSRNKCHFFLTNTDPHIEHTLKKLTFKNQVCLFWYELRHLRKKKVHETDLQS
jgi:hypothetical protein